MKRQRLGIMGGTFDPVHYGHLATAEAARERYGLERVLFMPVACPPHKRPGTVTPFWERYLMVMLAIYSNPYFELSRLEYDRGGVSYTIDTMRQLREIYGSETELYFICGADTMLEVSSWKEPQELLKMCKFLVASRRGYNPERLYELLGEAYRDAVTIMELPILDISSTEIRERVKAGRSIKYLLPEAVESYIYRHHIY